MRGPRNWDCASIGPPPSTTTSLLSKCWPILFGKARPCNAGADGMFFNLLAGLYF